MLRAYVDEAGDRGVSATGTDFFVMSAVVVSDTDRPAVQGRLAAIRNHLNKPPGTILHFAKNIRQHGARVYVCQEIASLTGVTIVSVVMCKRPWTSVCRSRSAPRAPRSRLELKLKGSRAEARASRAETAI